MPLLEQAVTLLRGYGLQVWSFWQDVEQVRANYPTGHSTLVNNAAGLS
jgi:type IV secretion system protein VirD4